MNKTIRVILADDHPFLRAGIRATLTAEPDIEVIGEAADSQTAQQLSHDLQPDVLLLDLRMPGLPPAETVAYIHTHCPKTRVIVLTAYTEDIYVRSLLSVGIAGYILKDEVVSNVILAIRTIAQGGTWFSQPVAARVVAWAGTQSGDKPTPPTERELEVLVGVAKGLTNAQIANELGISERTVRAHVENLFARLGVDNRVSAAIKAIQLGWVQLS